MEKAELGPVDHSHRKFLIRQAGESGESTVFMNRTE